MRKKMERAPAAVTANLPILATYGTFALVHGVYPEGLVRSLTRAEERHALKALKTRDIAAEMVARAATGKPAFAIIPLKYVQEPENDYGEVHP